NALQSSGEKPALAAFHDALPNDNFRWRDADRKVKRFWIRFKNKFRERQKPEVAPDYEPSVLKVCDELIRQGLAAKWRSAGSMLVMRKLAELPRNFSEIARQAGPTYPATLSHRNSRHWAAHLVDRFGVAEVHDPRF